METMEADGCLFLALPDACLLAVLQCCAANDQRSVLSAARAHSRLHQAAALALRSITVVGTRQEQADSVLLYLRMHRQHVERVSIRYQRSEFCPPSISLCLHLEAAPQQSKQDLFASNGFQSVLRPTLTQLQLESCILPGGADALAAVLSQLPSLEHLSLRSLYSEDSYFKFPSAVVQQLQQLTFLELDGMWFLRPDDGSPILQPLQALTRLVDVRIKVENAAPGYISIMASMLSSAHRLTRLDLAEYMTVEAAVLAGKTRLQHLQIVKCTVVDAAGNDAVAQLLSHLQQLQQLTHLNLSGTLWDGVEEDNPPASGYAALTASSKLQHLDISECALPAGAWQHVFPAGRQLPQLRDLNITELERAAGGEISAPEGRRLVSCCPGLQCLLMQAVQDSAELLVALRGLSGLRTLHWGDVHAGMDADIAQEGLQLVCQLTGLRKLEINLPCEFDHGLVLQVAQLKQLTALTCRATEKFWLSTAVSNLKRLQPG
jgi:hypothetical protein